jgi:ketosteroid isomerase-like protein
VSAENVALVRAAFAAWDVDELDGLEPHLAPDVDWRAIPGAPDDVGLIEGREALRAYYQDWYDTFADLRNDLLDVIDAGEDTVVAHVRASGVARGSGVPTELTYAIVYTLRDGKIVSGREHATREQAMEAAGLPATT